MNSTPTFREIRADDMAAIFDVRVAAWHNDRGREELTGLGITPDSVRALLGSSHQGWLCTVDSQVVGLAMGDRTNGEMWGIAVLSEFEGRAKVAISLRRDEPVAERREARLSGCRRCERRPERNCPRGRPAGQRRSLRHTSAHLDGASWPPGCGPATAEPTSSRSTAASSSE